MKYIAKNLLVHARVCRRFLLLAVSVFYLAPMLVQAQPAAQLSVASAQDLELLREACQALRQPSRRNDCIAVLARQPLSKSTAATAAGVVRRANEEIKLRWMSFDSGDVRDALREICVDPGSVYKKEDLDKSEIWCKFDKRGRMSMPRFAYGNLTSVGQATVNADGSLVTFEATGSQSEMLQLAALLEEKYGQPQREEAQIENRLGQKFAQQIYRWIDSKGTVITIHSIYDKIDSGQMMIASASAIQTIETIQKLQKEVNKGRL